MTKTDALVWTCRVCQRPIADRSGYIAVNHGDIDRYEQGLKAWETAHPSSQGGMTTLADWSDYPSEAHWQVLHQRCDQRPNRNDYTIEVERIRTLTEVINWTAHLMSKVWLDATDWGQVLHRVTGERVG